jgi:hypothetical protein
MLNRNKVLIALIKYFKEKGRVLSVQEYSREADTPVRIQAIKEVFGSWKKMETIIMATENGRAESRLNVDEMIRERGAAQQAASEQWKEASENQDVKARREAEAQAVAEILARNAATPEGANANKVAIGGKLPQEQQDYSAMGATVQTDPQTLEQTVVDVEPEIVTTANEDPRTPYELRDAVAADGVKTGSVPVGTATAGGSTGQASTDTVDALGADAADADKIKDKSTTNATSTENTKVPNDETKAAPTKK